jgi:hypothetical protein
MFFSNRKLLIQLNEKVDKLMTQDTDLAAAVAQELTDTSDILAKLASIPTVANDPVLAQAISDLQANHVKVQAVLNPPVVTPAVV